MKEDRKFDDPLSLLVDWAPNAVVVIGESGLIEALNSHAAQLFGYAREELLNEPLDQLLPERFRKHHPRLRQSFYADPQARPMGVGRDLYGLRKDGTEIPIEIGLNPIRTDKGLFVLSAILDLTARKRQEARFRQVVESAPNAIVMVNMDGRIELVNAQTERMFGYSRDELLGLPIEALVPERLRGHHPAHRNGFFADPLARPMGAGRDLYGLRKDGTEFPVEIGLNPIEMDGGTMVLSAIVDISDRKHKEARIEAALREKEILLGEVHHRVKNNLQIVYSLLDLQAAQTEDGSVAAMLRDSQNRVRSMALIHQTLYMSNDFGSVDFENFLETLLPSLIQSYGIGGDRVSLALNLAPVHVPISAAIPCGLIVNELVTNALKHAFPDGRRGRLKVDLAELGGDEIRLSVADDGVGIPDTFDIETSESLGLQLVRLLTGQLGGRLDADFAEETRFTLHFPRSRSSDGVEA